MFRDIETSGQMSPRYMANPGGFPQQNLSPNEVSRIVGVAVKGGEKIKGIFFIHLG